MTALMTTPYRAILLDCRMLAVHAEPSTPAALLTIAPARLPRLQLISSGPIAGAVRRQEPDMPLSAPRHALQMCWKSKQSQHCPVKSRTSTRFKISVFPNSGMPLKIRACSVPSGLYVAES
jgi:hypothetical protein